MVPCLYLILEDLKKLPSRMYGRIGLVSKKPKSFKDMEEVTS
jgi:hypothetical protein